MKKLLTVFLLVVVCRTVLVAQIYQYHPLVDSGSNKEWNYACYFQYGAMGGGTVNLQLDILMSGDTLIDGLHYRKISNTSWGNSLYIGAVLEDTLRRVFFKAAGDTSGTIGNCIFDFSLAKNDTFNSPQNYGKVFFVRSIDTILLGGVLRREFVLSQLSFGDTTPDVWVEGIGSLLYGIYFDGQCFFYTLHLCREKENDSLIYSSPGCIFTDIVESDFGKLAVYIYPNPVTNTVNLEFKDIEQHVSATIIDISGREIMPLFLDKQVSTFSFDTNSLASGVYCLKVSSSSGKNVIIKLVKE